MDYSDAIAYLAHGEGGGRIQFHTWTTENRGVQRAKSRIDVQLCWTYQWYLRRLSKLKEKGAEEPSASNDHLGNDLEAMDLSDDEEEEKEQENFYDLTKDVVEEDYGNVEIDGPCSICNSKGPILCWHKVDKHFQFVFQSGFNLRKPKYDFLNSTYLSISALAVSPSPSSATWMAVGTGFGLVQLLCNEHFYHPDMDIAISNLPSAPLPHSIYTNLRSQNSLRRSTTSNKPKQRKSGTPKSRIVIAKKEETPKEDIHSDSTEPCTEYFPSPSTS